ncbi:MULTISPECIES: hypothetical protein [Vibrio]|uniref:Uncharacterized protein n=1 Tax=Vibrio cyclitrophicus TaxID=47951 RepID=A0ACD5G4W3_9VIBR|nr:MULTISPECIES: hypothetical protein [Vibrio]
MAMPILQSLLLVVVVIASPIVLTVSNDGILFLGCKRIASDIARLKNSNQP